MLKNNNIFLKVFSFYLKVRVLPLITLIKKLARKTKQLFIFSRKEFGKYHRIQSDFDFEDMQFNKLNFILPDSDILLKHKDAILRFADEIVNHNITIFNKSYNVNLQSSDIKLFVSSNIQIALQPECYNVLQNMNESYRKIDWSKDFESDYRWLSNQLASKLRYDQIGADIKIPWELGRLQYLIVVAYAAFLTDSKDNKYHNELTNQIIDFIGSNPVGYGIQWKSPMDVAIRLVNLLFVVAAIKFYSIRLDDSLACLIKNSIVQHLEFIISNPEWNEGLRGNHYLFCISAILLTAIVLPDTIHSINLRHQAFTMFIKELYYQFQPDGTNFEASLPYHFFASEAVLLINKIITQSNDTANRIDGQSEGRIKAIAMACKALSNKDGSVPQIGDNDSGYLLKLHPDDIFSESELNYNHVLRLIDDTITQSQNLSFEDFGIYVFRKDRYCLYFRCGQVGQHGKGGHAHNDQLSFVLYIQNKPFFVDAGTFCYTRDHHLRNQYRSTEYHNTIVCLNQEQNIFFDNTMDDLFWLFDKAKSVVNYFDNEKIAGEHFGYRMSGKTVVCKREINMSDYTRIIIKDYCAISEKHINLHLHPDVVVTVVSDNKVRMTSDDIEITLTTEDGIITTGTYLYSPGYFQQKKAGKLKIIPIGEETVWEIRL